MGVFEFPTFPTLVTSRLILREVEAEDAEAIFALRSDPVVQRYNSADSLLHTVAEAREHVQEIAEAYAAGEAITWGVTLRGEDRVLGLFGLYFREQRPYMGSLGYDLVRTHWRQGIATEACRAIMRFGFEEMELHRIHVDTRMDNVASVRLLATLGFTHEGVCRECVRSEDGSWQDWGMFGILEQEYRRQPSEASQPRS